MLDRCTDATEAARPRGRGRHDAARDRRPPAPGVGHARRQGMDLAAERLPPDGLIATTDADSEPAPDWLRAQLDAVAAGARAIGGRIEVGAHDLPPAALAPARGRRAPRATPALTRRRARASTTSSAAPRWRSRPRPTRRSAGSSRARRWRTRASSARCAATACRSSGSPRCASRPPAGASGAPAAGSPSTCAATRWLAERSYDADDFTLEQLLAAKDRSDQRDPADARGRGDARRRSSTRSRRSAA